MSVVRIAPAGTLPVVPLTDLTTTNRDVAHELDRVWRRVADSSDFIGGESVARFEEEWARYCGTRHAVGVANGTDAIELALRALGIGPGDEVIVPANTFIATVEACVLAGASPRFADVDPETLLLTPETIEAALTPKTAAVIAVELYANMPNMGQLVQMLERRHLALIEDAAQAHGSTWEGRRAGAFGVVGCFSFYPTKNLGAFGDAGAVVTSDSSLAERIRSLANHGRRPGNGHVHSVLARNSRLDALQAAVLSVKLRSLDRWNRSRRLAVSSYRRLLDPHLVRMVSVDTAAESTYHQNVVRVGNRDRVRSMLATEGIETGIHYPVPCHLQEPYRSFSSTPLPIVETAATEILSLPLFPHITDDQVRHVAESVMEAVRAADGLRP